MRCCAGAAALLLTACLDAPPAAIGGGGDAADASPPAVCGTTRVVHDEFDAMSSAWTAVGSVAVESGMAQLYAAPEGTSGIASSWAYQLADGELTMQIRRLDLPDGELVLHLMNAAEDLVGLELAGGTLSLVQEVGGDRTVPEATPYEDDMLWWRLTESAGTVRWQTATDGTDWTDRGSTSVELPGPVTVQVQLTAGSIQAVAEIESFSPSSEESPCPATTLVDDFTVLSPRWLVNDVADCSVIADGALVFTHDGAESCGVDSAEHFDLRDSQIVLEVVDAGDCDPFLTFALDLPGVKPAFFCARGPDGPILYAQANAPGDLAMVEFDAGAHRLWRIRHDLGGSQIVFEVASAIGDWSRLGVMPIDEEIIRSAGVSIDISDDAADGDSGPVSVDRLNLVP